MKKAFVCKNCAPMTQVSCRVLRQLTFLQRTRTLTVYICMISKAMFSPFGWKQTTMKLYCGVFLLRSESCIMRKSNKDWVKIMRNTTATSIAFTRDIVFSKYFSKGYEKADLMDNEIINFLQSSGHVVANMEAPVTAGDIKSERKLNHVNSPEVVPYLLKLNARIWSLANNHVMDCQEQGLRDTLEIATKNGIRTMGAGLCKKDAARWLELSDAGGIDRKAYRRLWPLGAVNYCHTDRTAGIWLKPEKANYGPLRWLWDDIGFHGFSHAL